MEIIQQSGVQPSGRLAYLVGVQLMPLPSLETVEHHVITVPIGLRKFHNQTPSCRDKPVSRIADEKIPSLE